MPCRFLCLAILLFSTVAPDRAAPVVETTPTLSSIIDGVIARDALTQKELRAMEYDQTLRTERMDAKGNVTSKQEVKMVVQPGAVHEIRVVETHGDNIPTDPDQAKAQAQGKEAERRKQTFDLRTLATRFILTLQGESTAMGPKAYIIGFEPKPNQPYTSQTEKVLNQLHGRLWVRASDDTILRTEATLAHPVSVAWIFASIDQLHFHYELPSGGSEYGPAWIETVVTISAPLIRIDQRQRVDMTNFRPRSAPAANATAKLL